MTNEQIFKAAIDADREYNEVLRIAGYKTRWCDHCSNSLVQVAYKKKVLADADLLDAMRNH